MNITEKKSLEIIKANIAEKVLKLALASKKLICPEILKLFKNKGI